MAIHNNNNSNSLYIKIPTDNNQYRRIITMTGYKQCPICRDWTGNRKRAVLKHLNENHSSTSPETNMRKNGKFPCHICNISCTRFWSLTRHYKKQRQQSPPPTEPELALTGLLIKKHKIYNRNPKITPENVKFRVEEMKT